ncbi:MAG: universal stress protein [Verrucomicrobia bacterium]|nr:universal stress protein [Verrucomicrobiota bacterium]
MIVGKTKRPRNVDALRAAAILYGDWGTSKAYVLGLAFAVAGYSSFWLIATMCVLMALVGVNYMAICRHYPDGGGVYASVRHRSEVISIVGAFLLIADYIVTASLSALSAFQYLGVDHAELWAGAAILFIGFLNYFGPKHTGGLAFLVSMPTIVVVILLGLLSIPHLGAAVRDLRPMSGNVVQDWTGFVSIVLALSGVEAVANATGVMKLDPGSTDEHPSVVQTSSRAILWVMAEVCFFTAFLGLVMHALPGLTPHNGEVDAPGHPGVRDYMLRYMGEVFAGSAFGPVAGQVAAWCVSIVFGVLLVSAVNTAIVGLIAIFFMMSRDGEIPASFERLNPFGVPTLGLLFASIVPALLVVAVKDVSGLADLYAVGVVGAIATNLGSTSTDRSLHLEKWERVLMFSTFIIMSAIEITLFAVKPNARVFCAVILSVGLILHGLVTERAQKRRAKEAAAAGTAGPLRPLESGAPSVAASFASTGEDEESFGAPMICAVRGIGRTLDFALDEARSTKRPLYLLFVREQPVLLPEDRRRRWVEDAEARAIFHYASERSKGIKLLPCYAVSDSAADTIVEIAATVGASYLILGAPQRSALVNLLRGNIIRNISGILPEEIHLLVYA